MGWRLSWVLDARRLEPEAALTIISPPMQSIRRTLLSCSLTWRCCALSSECVVVVRLASLIACCRSASYIPNFDEYCDQLLIARYSHLPAFVRAWQRGSERSSYRPVGDHMESKAHEKLRSCQTGRCPAPVVGRVPRDSIQSREHHARHYIT